MDATRWIVVAYFIVWAFVFGSLAWSLRTAPAANGDKVRWPILAALAYLGLSIAVVFIIGTFLERDVARELTRWVTITGTAPLGLLVFKMMCKYWPWRKGKC